MIIAIDGPAASGKGTIARQLASVYGLHHLDTGLLYRAVAKAMLDAGHPTDDAAHATEIAVRLDPTKFEENALKLQPITEAASVVAAIPQVRQALINYQREFAMRPPGSVLDGRDIGTVIAPGADLLRRDERDSRRSVAPLKPAPDAHLLDTTHLGIDAAFRAAVDIIEAVRAGRKRR